LILQLSGILLAFYLLTILNRVIMGIILKTLLGFQGEFILIINGMVILERVADRPSILHAADTIGY